MSLQSQMAHAAWDASPGYDFEFDERSNPFAAVRIASEEQRQREREVQLAKEQEL